MTIRLQFVTATGPQILPPKKLLGLGAGTLGCEIEGQASFKKTAG